ncbi:Uncharacterised protein [Vibrio cholerae]|nr:Uncharacterised protein [Vibrio cholerae]CSC27600.1 Uncharacterised protein [Vibrio cholerae]CSI78012.1 Uncharacterised protein [Vibrio cholerae]
MTHAFARRSRYTCDIRNDRFCDVGFDESSCFFFRGTADFTDHHNRFSRWIFLEHLQDVDEV